MVTKARRGSFFTIEVFSQGLCIGSARILGCLQRAHPRPGRRKHRNIFASSRGILVLSEASMLCGSPGATCSMRLFYPRVARWLLASRAAFAIPLDASSPWY